MNPVDVCIVGSGAGGAPVAHDLARAGHSVVVLEKGPWYTEKDFDRDEIATVRRDTFVPFVADEPNVLAANGGKPARTTSGWISCCVGGGTVHMSGFVFRLDPIDFRMQTTYGDVDGATLVDWPITYDDLKPWYEKVESLVGVSGEGMPLPPLEANPLSALVDRGAKALSYHAFPTPRLVLTRARAPRRACTYCPMCGSYGCKTGAKGSTMASLIPKAVASGRCEVRPKSMAYRAVRYYDEDGNAREQPAKVIVVAAGAIQTARLLLNSELANSSGEVGKHLTFSTLAKGWGEWPLSALDRDPLEHRSRFLQRSIRDLYRVAGQSGYDKGGTINFLVPHANPIFTAERLSRRTRPPQWGADFVRALRRYHETVREIEFEVFSEFLPNLGTYVSLDPSVKDRWGIPSARIHLENHPLDRRNCLAVAKAAEAVLKAGGATRTGIEASGETTFVLQGGTARMGTVLDARCRAKDVANLYVTDGAALPTSGGVPTTLTIMANAFRVADAVAKALSG